MLKYIRSIFDEGCTASFSRWATACTVATSCWSVVHIVLHNHALPGATETAALAVWMVAPYSVNKAAAWSPAHRLDDPPPAAPPGSGV